MSIEQNKVGVGVSHHTRLNLDCDHVTSMNFGQNQPVYYRHTIKDEKIDIGALATVRPAPLAVPTYGRMRLRLSAFHVPYRLVFPQFDALYTDVIGSNVDYSSIVTGLPHVSEKTITDYFVNTIVVGEGPLTTQVSGSPVPPYDFQVGGIYYLYTLAGRRRLKILWSLGYRWHPNLKDDGEDLCILGLLCYAKVYIDWFANQNYLDSNDVLTIKRLLAYNDPTTPLVLTSAQLGSLLNLMAAVVYPSNYFTIAWDSPVSPNGGQFSTLTWQDPTSDNGSYISFGNTQLTPEMFQGNPSISIGTEYLHRALTKITDWTKRKQLSGALEIDRYLAEFGVSPSALHLNRSVYLGSHNIDVNVGDVMSTANTSSGPVSNLGDYSGKGFGQDKKHWEFIPDEFGMLVVVAGIMPSCGYYQGVDRHNLAKVKTDLFIPSLEGLSVQSVAAREVYISKDDTFGTRAQYNQDFGYVGTAAQYKRPLDYVTGDIALPAHFAGGDSWHLMREFDDTYFGGSAANIKHSLDFTRSSDWESFNRIFQTIRTEYDKFFVNFHFAVTSYAPCRPLMDTYDFEDSVKQIHIASNGAKVS